MQCATRFKRSKTLARPIKWCLNSTVHPDIRRFVSAGIALLALCAALPSAHGQNVADALARKMSEHDRARQVQISIDELRGKRQSLALGLDDQQRADALASTRATLALTRARNAELNASITAQRDAQAGLVPLLEQMLDLISDSVELDLPFDLAQRRTAIAQARTQLSDATVRAADRFDAVMGLYQELLRGAYTMDVQSERRAIAGEERLVTLLRVGRIALYALSDDAARCHVFRLSSRQWDAMTTGQCQRLSAAKARWSLDAVDGLPLSVEAP